MNKLLLLFATAISLNCTAQIDTEFWFGAPDLSKGTLTEARRDSSVYMVVSTLNEAAVVTILLPANLDFIPITVNLAANATQTVNLGNYLSLIETKPANTVVNTGILVRSTKPITAYYEIRGLANSDIFSLKGKNALGKKFYTPFQTEYQNNQSLGGQNYVPPPRSGFVVMATRDNTTITITPGNDLLDHPSGVPFTINMNRGQTYYCEALNWQAGSQPTGSQIISDLPVVVTMKDDLLDLNPANDSGADVIGDQLISDDYLGYTHIVVKSGLSNNGDRVVVCGTVDNTELYIDGSATPIIINAGEQHSYAFASSSSFVDASEKVAVLQVAGVSDQIAGAVIPSLECTGSQQVGFVRGNNRPFYLSITTRAGNEGFFSLNGDPSLVPASAFSPVFGSNGEYVFARISYSTTEIPVNAANLITNSGTELFHLGIMNGNAGQSCNYGYFSAFSYLNLGKSSEVCLGDSTILDAGPNKTSYLWSTGEDTQTITVYEAGIYTVTVMNGEGCVATDNIEVTYYEPPIDLGPNTTICEGTDFLIEIDGTFNFEWQDGSTENFFIIQDPGIYWVDVSDFQNCRTRDSITVAVSPRPITPTISGETVYCPGETLNLSISDTENATYVFTLPSGIVLNEQSLTVINVGPDQAGMYFGSVIVEGCESFLDTVIVSISPGAAVDLGTDVSVCAGESVIIDAGNPDELDFLWQDGSTESMYMPIESGTYYVDVTNEFGCTASDTVNVEFRPFPLPPVIVANQLSYCEGDNMMLTTAAQDGVDFIWTNTNGETLSTTINFEILNVQTANSGTYNLTAELNGCTTETESYILAVNTNPIITLQADTSLCPGNEIVLQGPGGFASYEWSTGETTQDITVSVGEYVLQVTTDAGCVGSDVVVISSNGPSADFSILPDTLFEPGTLLQFTDNSDSGPIASIDTWLWNFGNGSSSSIQNPNFIYTESGIYLVTLTVTDEQGCSASTSQSVISRFLFRIPEGFSPNGDGINDVLVIQGLEGLNGTSVQIFNRWGGVVYETSNYQPGYFWDGKDSPDGTYFYVVKLAGGESYSGPVTISR